MPAPAQARRLVRKSAFARLRNCSPANVTKLTRPGGKLADAVTPEGLIDLDLAERLLAERTDPGRVPEILAMPSAAAVAPGEAGAFASAKTRRALADAEAAEINLERIRGRLVEVAAATKAVELAVGAVIEILARLGDDAVEALRGAATSEDARRTWRRLQATAQQQINAEATRRFREAMADA